MSKQNVASEQVWGLSQEFDRSRKRENIIWVAATAAILLAAGVVPRLLNQDPAPVLREDEPALVVAMIPPHNEARNDVAPGFSEDVAGEIRVAQCDVKADATTKEQLSDCHEFVLVVAGHDAYGQLDRSTDVGDMITVSEKPSI
jgi:hypothetical protein